MWHPQCGQAVRRGLRSWVTVGSNPFAVLLIWPPSVTSPKVTRSAHRTASHVCRPGKKLAAAGEAGAGGEPGEGGRGVGRGRGEAGAQAGHPPGLVAAGVPTPVVRADQVRVAVRVR